MTRKRGAGGGHAGGAADGHVRIRRTVLRRIVTDRLQALLRGDFYVSKHLGPEDYDELVEEVGALDVPPPPPPLPPNTNPGGGKNGNSSSSAPSSSAVVAAAVDVGDGGGVITTTTTNPSPSSSSLTPNLETFVQLIAASIMIDASMRGENSGESDTRTIKKKKKLLASTLRGPKLYDFRREVLRFDRIVKYGKGGGGGGQSGGDGVVDDDDEEIVDSEESEEEDSDDEDEEEESDDDDDSAGGGGSENENDDDDEDGEGKRGRGKKKKKKKKADDASCPTTTASSSRGGQQMRPSPPPAAADRHSSEGRESSSAEEDDEDDDDEGVEDDRGRRRSVEEEEEEEGDRSTASDSAATSSANTPSGVDENSSTIDGFSTSATSSRHRHHSRHHKKKKSGGSSSRRRERKKLKKEEKRRKRRERKLRKKEKRRKAEKRLLLAEKGGGGGGGGKKRKKKMELDDDMSSEDATADSSVDGEDCRKDADDDDRDSDDDGGGGDREDGTAERRRQQQRSRKRRGGGKPEFATRQQFEEHRSEWLGRIPRDVKSRFREGGFSKWGKDWLPVLELGPFDVEPGPVRDTWLDMFRKTQENGRDMTRLVFWYGVKFEDRGQAYSFLPESKIVHYEEGERMGYCKMPKKIQQKIDKDAKLTKTEEQIRRGLIEIETDMKKDKSERVAWMMKWKEDFEYAEEEEELKSKLARFVEEEDAPTKRGPGRPKKEEGTALEVSIKRKPGRPKKSADAPSLDEEDGVARAKKKAKKSVDVSPLDEEHGGATKSKKKGPGRPKKPDKEKADRADEKALAKAAASSTKEKESTAKKWAVIDGDQESEIETEEDEDDRDYDDHVDSGDDMEINADEDENNSDAEGKNSGKKRKAICSNEKPKKKTKLFMTDEEKMIEKRAKAAVYRMKKARQKAEAQGLEYTKGKVGRKSKVALLELEQLKFTKCEGIFLPIMKRLAQATDDTNAKVALNCIDSITENVDLLTPPFLRDYSLGMLVKSVRKTFEGVYPEVRDCCKRLTTEMKRVYSEKENKVPEDFEAIKNYKFTPNVKQETSEEKDESAAAKNTLDLDKSERVIVKSEKNAINSVKVEMEQSMPSRHNSEMSLSESATRKMASATSSEYLPNVVTSDPPQSRPKKTFSIKGMFDKPKPADKPTISAPIATTVTSSQPSPKPKSLPSWVTGPAMKNEDFHEQHMKERAFGLEFLADSASSVMSTDKFDPLSVSQSFELAIFAETKLRGRDWHQYWEKIHDVVAMLSPGKDTRNAILQGIISGDYQEPSELVKLSRREIQSLNQLKS